MRRLPIARAISDNAPSGSHCLSSAVAAAVAQSRADWGVAIETVAQQNQLGFLPLTAEHFDFVIPNDRHSRPAVQHFIALLQDEDIRTRLQAMGFELGE